MYTAPLCLHNILNLFSLFFFNDTATNAIYTLSLHDALPISWLDKARFAFTIARLRRLASKSHGLDPELDRKSTRLNSSHVEISYAVFCLKKKKKNENIYIQLLKDTKKEQIMK